MASKNYFISFFLFSLSLVIIFSGTVAIISRVPKYVSLEDSQKTGSLLPTIVIDAGHGGEDGGAVGKNGIIEKELNLEIAKELEAMFISSGYQVVMTRNDDRMLYDINSDYNGRKKLLDLNERIRIAGSYENSIFISIHMNTYPIEKYNGLQVYYSQNSQESQKLAASVQTSVRSTLQPENQRKTKAASGNIYILEKISSPSVLIECGFISNPEECDKLCNENYRQKLSLSIFCGVNSYIYDLPS